MIMAGGTGGHIMPALAVAECLRAHAVEVVWIGTADGPEAKLAVRAGFAFYAVAIKGMRKSGMLRIAVMPFMLARAMLQMWRMMSRHRPQVVLGMGGFVSGPGGLVAALRGKPLLIHEQNAIAGMTNRHLARFATHVMSGFPQTSGMPKSTWVGNPVRREIVDVPPPQQRMRTRSGGLRVLVVGGSLGAQVFNDHLPKLLSDANLAGVEVRHQCGRSADPDAIAAQYRQAGIRCKVAAFIDDMAAAYSWCDVVVCRAGAMTIAEICAAGVAAILVPYPHAVSDHQTANARYLQQRAAAKLIAQPAFIRGAWLAELADELTRQSRKGLIAMATAARKLARIDAAMAVAKTCMEFTERSGDA